MYLLSTDCVPSTDCARCHGETGGMMDALSSLPSESLLPLKPAPLVHPHQMQRE